jgi:hypothetical protein
MRFCRYSAARPTLPRPVSSPRLDGCCTANGPMTAVPRLSLPIPSSRSCELCVVRHSTTTTVPYSWVNSNTTFPTTKSETPAVRLPRLVDKPLDARARTRSFANHLLQVSLYCWLFSLESLKLALC